MFLAVLSVILAAVAVNGDHGHDKCMRVFHPGAAECCTTTLIEPIAMEVKECVPDMPPPPHPHEKPLGPPPCDIDICVAKKGGFLGADDTIDKEALKQYLTKHLQPEILEEVQKQCLDGDIDAYGPKDLCEPMKMRHCIQFQWLKACDSWNTEGKCTEVKDAVAECEKQL